MRRMMASALISLFFCALTGPVHAATASGAGRYVPAARGSAPAKARKITKMAGYIGIVKSPAMVLLDGVEPWVKAKVGQQLTPGTQIKTKSGGSVTIAFTDGSKIRLGPNANFKLETVKRSKISMYIGLGKLEGWVKKLARRTFQIRNPVAVASVRGTVLATNVISPTQATFDCFSGSLGVTDNFGRTQSLSAGQRMSSNAQTGSSAPTKLPPNVKAPAEPPVNIPQLASADSPTTPLADSDAEAEGEDADADAEAEETTTEESAISEPNPVQDTATISGSSP